MKKVFFVAVLAITAFGNSYASESAIEELKSAVPSAALENAVPSASAMVKVAEKIGPMPATYKPGTMLSIEKLPASTPYQALMAEAYRRLKAGAVSANVEKDDRSCRIFSYWAVRGDSDPKIFKVVEMFPRNMHSVQYVMAEAYQRTKDGAKKVDGVVSDERITLSISWEIVK